MGKIKIQKEDLEKLVKKGLKDSEISKILNVKSISIYFARKRYKIERNSFSTSKDIPLTEKQKEFIVGSILGDGNLRIDKKCINPRYTCEHSIKQKEYAYYKYSILEGLKPFIKEYNRKIDKRTNKIYPSITLRLNNNPNLKWFYQQFYNPTKIINKEVLQYYSPLAMAIHFMDDGSKTGSSYYLATNGFDLISIKNLQEYILNNYNIKTNIHKGNLLYIYSESAKNFTNLIKPFIIESMNYKLHNF